MDGLEWMDEIEPKINGCEDLVVDNNYKITGNYCFEFKNTPFTLVGFVALELDGKSPHMVINLHRYMDKDDFYATSNAKGLCKDETCFYVSCSSINDDLSDGVQITVQ